MPISVTKTPLRNSIVATVCSTRRWRRGGGGVGGRMRLTYWQGITRARGRPYSQFRLLPRVASMHNGPCQTVRVLAHIDVPNVLKRREINHGNVIVGRARHEGSLAIRFNKNAGRAVSQFQSLDLFSAGGIEDGQISPAQAGH